FLQLVDLLKEHMPRGVVPVSAVDLPPAERKPLFDFVKLGIQNLRDKCLDLSTVHEASVSPQLVKQVSDSRFRPVCGSQAADDLAAFDVARKAARTGDPRTVVRSRAFLYRHAGPASVPARPAKRFRLNLPILARG